MKKMKDSLFQEKTSKKLDDLILAKADSFLAERREQHVTANAVIPRWVLSFASTAAVVAILFMNTSNYNDAISHSELNEIADSPIEAYAELELDLMHDKDLIEQDLNILADNEYEIE